MRARKTEHQSDMSAHLQSIVFAGMSPAESSRGASYWIDPSCRDSATAENRVLRIDVPERTDCPAVADEAGDPVDLSTSAAPDAGLPTTTRSQEVAGAVNTSLDTILPAQAVQVEVTVRSPNSLARRDFLNKSGLGEPGTAFRAAETNEPDLESVKRPF